LHRVVVTRSSYAGISPPEMRGTKPLAKDARQRARQLHADLVLLVAGKESMMRSMVCAALLVWRVEKTRWPVSAAVTAVAMVSGVRISPIISTSTSWRKTTAARRFESRRVDAHLALLDERLFIFKQILYRVLDGNDVLGALLFIFSISAASVVVLPCPTGPTTKKNPCSRAAKSRAPAAS
jgi:hypothetical protein